MMYSYVPQQFISNVFYQINFYEIVYDKLQRLWRGTNTPRKYSMNFGLFRFHVKMVVEQNFFLALRGFHRDANFSIALSFLSVMLLSGQKRT